MKLRNVFRGLQKIEKSVAYLERSWYKKERTSVAGRQIMERREPSERDCAIQMEGAGRI